VLQLTRLSGNVFALNPDLIERAEATPDTVLTLVNGGKYVIRESLDELIALICDYRAQIVAAAHVTGSSRTSHPSAAASSHVGKHGPAREVAARGTVIALRPEVE
jgi:flagellar protein FlbD